MGVCDREKVKFFWNDSKSLFLCERLLSKKMPMGVQYREYFAVAECFYFRGLLCEYVIEYVIDYTAKFVSISVNTQ
jgi:hypothetical protein